MNAGARLTDFIKAVDENLAKAAFVSETQIAYDVVFVINVNSRGWILEKICRVIGEASGLHCAYIYTERNDTISQLLPLARAYFFSHYTLYLSALRRNRAVASAMRFVWYTHPNATGPFSTEEVAAGLARATGVFTANNTDQQLLSAAGVPNAILHTVLGGADPQVFAAHSRTGRCVGLVGAYYERKNPDLMLSVIERMSDVRFLLISPHESEIENRGLLWPNWERFPQLMSLPNLEFIEAPYAAFPEHVAKLDVFLSLSRLEGGPIPLIEAMFANCYPVVTRTGFAPDIIEHRRNGCLLDIECDSAQAEAAIRLGLADTTTDIRSSVAELTWASFGAQIARRICPPPPRNQPIAFNDNAACRRYLREGWRARDKKGAVLDGGLGRVSFPNDGRRPVEMKVKFRVRTADPKVTVTFWYNGLKLAEQDVSGETGCQWRCVLPQFWPSQVRHATDNFMITCRTQDKADAAFLLEEISLFD
jgi:glycosyltransferase involved in cell wall biosynthesis